VVLPRIVGSGDHNPRGESLGMSKVCDAGSGNHSRTLDFDIGGTQPGRNRLRNPGTGFARVLPDHHPMWALRQMVPERPTDRVDCFSIQWIFAGNAADSVGSKKFSQEDTFVFVFTIARQSCKHRFSPTKPPAAVILTGAPRGIVS